MTCWRLPKDSCLCAELAVNIWGYFHCWSLHSLNQFVISLSEVWYFILIVPAFSQHQCALWVWAGSLVFLRCWVAFWPVVFSLVLFIYLLIYVNLCLSHPILIEIICLGLIQFMRPLYSQLMLWRTADYICSSFWCIVGWELETQYLGLTGWCLALQPVLKQ